MATATNGYVHGPDDGEVRWLGETCTRFLAGGAETDGSFALVDERAGRGESVPLHRHPADMESFYVLDGELTLYVGDEAGVRAGAGSFAHVPGGVIHGFRVTSETARYLILTTPRHGEFYRAITRSSPGPVEGAQIKQAAREYGIEFVGPLPDET